MKYLAVTKILPGGLVAKYQPFDTLEGAQGFAARFNDAQAFSNPGGINWRIENGLLVEVKK